MRDEATILLQWFKYGDITMSLLLEPNVDESEEQKPDDHHDQEDDDEIFHPTFSYLRC
jgi:hypothetical protein